MNFISFVTLQMTDWSKMIFVQEQTAMWKSGFYDDIHNRVFKCESSNKDYCSLVF